MKKSTLLLAIFAMLMFQCSTEQDVLPDNQIVDPESRIISPELLDDPPVITSVQALDKSVTLNWNYNTSGYTTVLNISGSPNQTFQMYSTLR